MATPRGLPVSSVEPLVALQARVQEQADLCEPDYACTLPALLTDLRFSTLDLDDHPSCIGGEELSLQIQGVDYLLTEHSRAQLLDHLGTREKWFKSVTLHDQSLELTRRIHALSRQKLRRRRSHVGLHYIRGIVSVSYADIPDVEIMNALCEAMPDGECLKHYSDKSDKAFYAYALTRSSVVGLGPECWGYPGAIVKNSEVGAGALWVVPFFAVVYTSGFMRPVALKRQAVLRKVHRGQYADLKLALSQALTSLQAVWGPMQDRLTGLVGLRFASEQNALDRLHSALTAIKASKRFIERCTTTYSAAKNTAHNGLTIFTAVLSACATEEVDSRYDDAEVAGYLLLQLL